MAFSSIKFNKGDFSIEIINQLLLPHELDYLKISSIDDSWHAIRDMKIR